MSRRLTLVFCLLSAGLQPALRAQDVPAVPLIRLEDLLVGLGQRYGIVVDSQAALDEHVVALPQQIPVAEGLARVLARHSYLLVYSGPWSGPLAKSPNRLLIFSTEPGSATRKLIIDEASDTTAPAAVDAIARVDDLSAAAGEDVAALASALGAELASSLDAAIREEAVYLLARLDPAFSRAFLAQALGDESPSVREAVVSAVAETRYPNATALLQVALADRDDGVREAAEDALLQIR